MLEISRTAVWKAVSVLQGEGYRIESVPNRGYRLTESEVYSAYEIEKRLTTRIVGRPLVFLEETGSTNDYAKELAAHGGENGTAIVARRQTAGKGRLGRSFDSPAEKGVYFTLLLRPDIHLEALNRITLLAAVAVADAVEELVLTGRHIAAADYTAAVFRSFERCFFDGNFPENQEEILARYREDLFFLGQQVEVRGMTECYRAEALDIDAEGRLLVRDGKGEIHALNSGEISIRFS